MKILRWFVDNVVSKLWLLLMIIAICNILVIVKIYLLSKALDRIEACVHSPEEQPQAQKSTAPSVVAPSATSTPEGQDCTVELAMQASTDLGKKYLEERKKDSAGALTYFQKMHQVVDSLPVPAELPKLPDITIHVNDWNQSTAAKNDDGKCALGPTKTLVTESHGGGSWRSVLALWAGSFSQRVQDAGDGEGYETQVYLSELDEGAYVAHPSAYYSDFTTGSLEGIRKVVLQAIEDEEEIQTLAQWAVPLLPTLLTGSQEQAKQWLRDFWPASQTNFTSLKTAVTQYDKQTESVDKYRGTYYYQHNSKREGMFLRRWINKGGGKAGDDYILVLRFWMVRVAEALGMPEAKTWANQIQSKMRGATTLKFGQFYIDELKRIRGVE